MQVLFIIILDGKQIYMYMYNGKQTIKVQFAEILNEKVLPINVII